MPQCIVVADDLTGANATGVLLKKMNYRTYTVMNAERLRLSMADECDCIMYPTDSRAIISEIAYQRVYNVTRLLAGDTVRLYGKRIDSTLRGNVGSETDAMLDALGPERIAIAAPCFPDSGRIVAGGYMLVKGIPLHRTEAALDPRAPVATSNVREIFESQSKYRVGTVMMNSMMNGKEALSAHIRELAGQGCRILTFDCVTQEDLDLIADAVIMSGIDFISVDPGVFTATVARKLIVPPDRQTDTKILAVVGSVNPVTKAQMENLWLSQKAAGNIFVNTREFIRGDSHRDSEITRVVDEAVMISETAEIVTVTGDGINPECYIDFSEWKEMPGTPDEFAERINESLAEIAYRIFSRCPSFQGMYTSGGDVTQAVCRRFGTAGLALIGEVLPLAAYGQFLKGDFEGLHIITKGGMVGDKDAADRCITYLKEKLFM